MNCKPGDLAFVIGGERTENIGAIVSVIRPYTGPTHHYRLAADWVVEWHGKEYAACDSLMRPIRPGDISDEEVRDLYAPKQPEHA